MPLPQHDPNHPAKLLDLSDGNAERHEYVARVQRNSVHAQYGFCLHHGQEPGLHPDEWYSAYKQKWGKDFPHLDNENINDEKHSRYSPFHPLNIEDRDTTDSRHAEEAFILQTSYIQLQVDMRNRRKQQPASNLDIESYAMDWQRIYKHYYPKSHFDIPHSSVRQSSQIESGDELKPDMYRIRISTVQR